MTTLPSDTDSSSNNINLSKGKHHCSFCSSELSAGGERNAIGRGSARGVGRRQAQVMPAFGLRVSVNLGLELNQVLCGIRECASSTLY